MITETLFIVNKWKKNKEQKRQKLDEQNKENATIILLTGQQEAGKDTIKNILLHSRFVEAYKSTTGTEDIEVFPYKTTIKVAKILFIKKQLTINEYIEIYNTGGGKNKKNAIRDEIISKLEQFKHRTIYYVYVFDVAKYLSDTDKRKDIEMDFNTIKEQNKIFIPKIIGTHKDIAKNYDDNLANSIRMDYDIGCEIWDLTRAKTKAYEVKKELLDFIIGG